VLKRFPIQYRQLIWLLSAVSLFLSLWIILPAPTLWLLPLAVGAPEISPGLLALNAIALLLVVFVINRSRQRRLAIACSLLGLLLSALPLLQFPGTVARSTTAMQATLGSDYLATVPQSVQAQMRPYPFVLADLFTGIPAKQVRHTSGVRFATPNGVPLTLEIYHPLPVGKYPTLITFYSGAWRHGKPTQDASFNQYMAAQGYTVIAIDYRHAPQFPFPAQLQDVQTALKFIQQHATEYEVNLDHIALLGRSAGAHLALLAAYQPKISPIPIQAVVSYYGPTDLAGGYANPPFPDPLNVRAVLEDFLAGSLPQFPFLYQDASPIHYVRSGLPPTLLVYGDRDHIVEAKFGRALYQRLQAVGNPVVWIEIPWAEHVFDTIQSGLSNQLALYYTERFLAWALQ